MITNSKRLIILEETVKLLSGVKKLKLTWVNTTEIISPGVFDSYFYFYNNVIFLFDTLEKYSRFFDKILAIGHAQEPNLDIKSFVYCENLTKQKLQTLLDARYESFLVEEKGKISLNAITLFSEPQHCRDPKLIEINQFSDKEKKWKTDKFLSLSIYNFHGCKLYISHGSDLEPPFIFKNPKEGLIFEMISALATSLNFTFDPSHNPTRKEMDFFTGEYLYQKERLIKGCSLSDPIFTSSAVFLVPPGRQYLSWEKLTMPFDQLTWTWLGIVFVTAFLVILLIKLSRSKSIYDFVVASEVTTPTLNVFATFMGSAQLKVPLRNVSRFLFMSFILFCLIMRTAYQGKYFEFLTSDMRKKPIQTVEELIANNFSLYSASDVFNDLKLMNYEMIEQ